MPLTDVRCRNAKGKIKPHKLSDGQAASLGLEFRKVGTTGPIRRRPCASALPIRSLFKADHEEAATVICEGNNLLRYHRSVIVVRQVKPFLDLYIQCFPRFVDEIVKIDIRTTVSPSNLRTPTSDPAPACPSRADKRNPKSSEGSLAISSFECVLVW